MKILGNAGSRSSQLALNPIHREEQDMNSRQKLQADDYAMALQELNTYTDVSVDDLMRLHQAAEKYARIRNTESMRVNQFMTQPVTTVAPECSLSDAAHLLVTHKISGLPVVDHNDQLVGIITEADFLRALGVPSHHPSHSLWQTLENMFSPHVQVREAEGLVADLMVKEVISVSPQQTLHHVVEAMKQNHIKRLIACDDDRHVVGIITRSSLVRIFFDHFKPVNHDSNKG